MRIAKKVVKEPLQNHIKVNVRELKTFDKFCEEMGNNIDADFCKELESELINCPECKVYYDTIKKTVQVYQICEEKNDINKKQEEKLFKILNLEKPQSS
ncbi:MAG: hypothetical protein KAI81_05845 [Candidatus Marinimicrobia bacterium]|nr:hypothetical protein [Candidatus Neomarinimicrobiota bacterium]